ncbi:DUF4157 domain-containing protein [Streptomyces sp. NPDC058257]|uniref:eCIS core domain-containing protein n=1 Tax=Streptomyces sp. NPDC058257 TaxID=3346409 RepID=UPI0036EC3AFB
MALARDDNNKAGARRRDASERVRPATTRADAAVQRMLDLQGSIGNGGVVQMLRQTGHEWARHQHGAGCGHETQAAQGSQEARVQRSVSSTVAREALEDEHAHMVVPDTSPEGQAALVAEARNSPSESLPSAVVDKAVPFYQNQRIASTRVHRDAIAQRATAAMGAEAMTIDNHIFLSAKAVGNEETIGHELSHVDKNTRGVVETGHSNGAGVTTTDPRQGSEHAAGADGHAYAAGEATAPSLTAQRKTTDHGEELTKTGTVQRAPAAYYLPEEEMTENPGFSTILTATLNGHAIGTWTSKTTAQSEGDHAEDQLLDYLDSEIAHYEATGNPDSVMSTGVPRSRGGMRHQLAISITASPCSSKHGTSRKTYGEGCAERLIDYAENGYMGHKFTISMTAAHYYQPQNMRGGKGKSKDAVKDMRSAGIHVSVS